MGKVPSSVPDVGLKLLGVCVFGFDVVNFGAPQLLNKSSLWCVCPCFWASASLRGCYWDCVAPIASHLASRFLVLQKNLVSSA